MLNWWEKNLASCELGDERLNKLAYAIGKGASHFGKYIKLKVDR